MLEKPVPPRPFSVWVLPSLTLWARYDSKAANEPTLATFICFLPFASFHPQPLGSLVRFAVGPISASSTVTTEQIGTACPARLAAVRSTTEDTLIMKCFSFTHLRQFADQNRRNSLTLLEVVAQRVKM